MRSRPTAATGLHTAHRPTHAQLMAAAFSRYTSTVYIHTADLNKDFIYVNTGLLIPSNPSSIPQAPTNKYKTQNQENASIITFTPGMPVT